MESFLLHQPAEMLARICQSLDHQSLLHLCLAGNRRLTDLAQTELLRDITLERRSTYALLQPILDTTPPCYHICQSIHLTLTGASGENEYWARVLARFPCIRWFELEAGRGCQSIVAAIPPSALHLRLSLYGLKADEESKQVASLLLSRLNLRTLRLTGGSFAGANCSPSASLRVLRLDNLHVERDGLLSMLRSAGSLQTFHYATGLSPGRLRSGDIWEVIATKGESLVDVAVFPHPAATDDRDQGFNASTLGRVTRLGVPVRLVDHYDALPPNVEYVDLFGGGPRTCGRARRILLQLCSAAVAGALPRLRGVVVWEHGTGPGWLKTVRVEDGRRVTYGRVHWSGQLDNWLDQRDGVIEACTRADHLGSGGRWLHVGRAEYKECLRLAT